MTPGCIWATTRLTMKSLHWFREISEKWDQGPVGPVRSANWQPRSGPTPPATPPSSCPLLACVERGRDASQRLALPYGAKGPTDPLGSPPELQTPPPRRRTSTPQTTPRPLDRLVANPMTCGRRSPPGRPAADDRHRVQLTVNTGSTNIPATPPTPAPSPPASVSADPGSVDTGPPGTPA